MKKGLLARQPNHDGEGRANLIQKTNVSEGKIHC